MVTREGHPLVRIVIQVISRVKRTCIPTSHHRIPTLTYGKALHVISRRIRWDLGLTMPLPLRCTDTDMTLHSKEWAILLDWHLMPCRMFLLLGIEQHLMMTALI